jgi:hypothetical protein
VSGEVDVGRYTLSIGHAVTDRLWIDRAVVRAIGLFARRRYERPCRREANPVSICLSREIINAMPFIITEAVFSEPSGRPLALVHLCGALVLSGTFGYYVVVEGVTPASAVLFLIAGMAIAGIAESLPRSRQLAAGILRLTALSVLVSMLAIIVFIPELFTR